MPCGPINTIDQGVAFAEAIGLDPVVEVGEGDAAVPSVRNPITLLGHPGRTTGCRRRRWTSTARDPPLAGRSARRSGDLTEYPDRARRLHAGRHHAARRRTWPRDVMGSVGFGELAFWLATQRRPTPGETRVFEAVLAALADHGFTPTAIVTRLTYLSAPDSVQGALAAGLLGGGSRFLGVTEDCGRFLHDVLDRRSGALPTDDAGWDALALETVAAQRAARRFVPGPGPPRAQGRRPAHPAAVARSPPRRAWSARTCRCSPRSAGCTRRCWAGRCRSTAPGSAAPRWPTSGCRWSCCAASPCWPAPPG